MSEAIFAIHSYDRAARCDDPKFSFGVYTAGFNSLQIKGQAHYAMGSISPNIRCDDSARCYLGFIGWDSALLK